MQTGFRPVSHKHVVLEDAFWAPRQEINRTVTLSIEYEHLKETGRIDALRLDWKPGTPNAPHIFWESDVAKWIEAAAYVLARHPDPELERRVDEVVELLRRAQQTDGYVNVHFTLVEPGKRWSNLRDWHELYCAGHLIEAAVALYEATGKRTLLDVMRRYADCIAEVFGPQPGAKQGYPGHEEIELALVRLTHATGDRRYIELSRVFVDRRGTSPNYFEAEAAARGEDPAAVRERLHYWQAHCPVREQTTAEGHAVRAMYLYCAMADLVAETGDRLREACERLFVNVTDRRMYVTGGVGSNAEGERFTRDYDLPNDTAYAETCAAIGLVFWMARMLQLDCDTRYADILERALYNGTISGVSLDGKRFFYVNPLAVHRTPEQLAGKTDANERFAGVRREWFGCACCPPNIARMVAAVGRYFYSAAPGELAVHLFGESRATVEIDGRPVAVTQQTRYPWDGTVRFGLDPGPSTRRFGFRIRVPGWCPGATFRINGRTHTPEMLRGYARLEREWRAGDVIECSFPMPVRRLYAHPRVRFDCGRAAFQRGPIVYCFEGTDNGNGLEEVSVPRDASLKPQWEPNLLGGVVVLRGRGKRLRQASGTRRLYSMEPPDEEWVDLQAVPYCVWENRELGDMQVWIRETPAD
ncbi:MAG: glycoside hydrolase family 127 protein [Kiritimatiellaeota bacterium]|nr:glycoside hydrolase family 127 protein [Kiritimatiellota bacterium]